MRRLLGAARFSRATLVALIVGLWVASGLVFAASPSPAPSQFKLTASDGNAADLFGTSVAISGETAVVSSPHESAGAVPAAGAAYIFTRSGRGWTEQAKLTASDAAPGDRFGWSVAIAGDTVVVGSFWDDIGANVDQGSAYLFTRSGGAWTQQAKVTPSDGAALDQFGYSVAVSEDTAVVGANWADVGGKRDQGAAYAFTRTGAMWTEQAKLTSSDGRSEDEFGLSAGLSGDTVVVGAPVAHVGDNAEQGAAYVFTRTGESWTQQARLVAPDGLAGDRLGFSVAISGETVVAGAYLDDGAATSIRARPTCSPAGAARGRSGLGCSRPTAPPRTCSGARPPCPEIGSWSVHSGPTRSTPATTAAPPIPSSARAGDGPSRRS